ncbi:MAG: PQQ-binding-like beta-propeller repeat protein [Bryobacterales bacterium]
MPLIVSLLLVLAAGPALAGEWPRFRGPNGSGVASGSGYPIAFGPDHNRLWRAKARPGKSSPVLTATRLFLTAAEGGRLYTQCFDRKTGKLVWERNLMQPHQEIANKLNHEAAITPVTDGDNVYAFFKDFGLVAYSANGEELWQAPLGPFVNLMGVSASPILSGTDIVVVVDQWEGSFIAAFDRMTGEMRWKTPREEREGWATPLLHRGRIVTTSRGRFGLHDTATGKRIGGYAPVASTIVGSPVVDGDTLSSSATGTPASGLPSSPRSSNVRDKNGDGRLTPEEYGDDPIANHFGKLTGNRDGVLTEDKWEIFRKSTLGFGGISALRFADGGAEELWRHEGNFISVIPSLLAYEGVLYVVRNGGILNTYDAASGDEIGVARLRGALGGYSASPVAADGHIWFASEEGNMAVVRAGRDWDVEQVNEIGEAIFATPALADGVLYLRTEGSLYAFAESE